MTANKKGLSAANTETSNKSIPRQYVNENNIEDYSLAQHSSNEMRTKQCLRCKKVKSIVEFSRNTKTVDGHLNSCFACSRPRNAVKRQLRLAINAKCRDCVYDPIAGGGSWRQQVEACTSGNCPLFDVRPTSGRAS